MLLCSSICWILFPFMEFILIVTVRLIRLLFPFLKIILGSGRGDTGTSAWFQSSFGLMDPLLSTFHSSFCRWIYIYIWDIWLLFCTYSFMMGMYSFVWDFVVLHDLMYDDSLLYIIHISFRFYDMDICFWLWYLCSVVLYCFRGLY